MTDGSDATEVASPSADAGGLSIFRQIVPEHLTCEACGDKVPIEYAFLRLSSDGRTLAWNHREHAGGKCVRHSAMRGPTGEPMDDSARLANLLDSTTRTAKVQVLDFGDVVAYWADSAQILLWVSAHVLAPAGLEPRVSFTAGSPGATVVTCATGPGGFRDGEPVPPLRVTVGDWVVTSPLVQGVASRMSGQTVDRLIQRELPGDCHARTEIVEV